MRKVISELLGRTGKKWDINVGIDKNFLLGLPILYIRCDIRNNRRWGKVMDDQRMPVRELRQGYGIFNRLSLEEALRSYDKRGHYGISTQIYILELGKRAGYISENDSRKKIQTIVKKIEVISFEVYGEVLKKEMELIYMDNRNMLRYIRRKMKLLNRADSPWKTIEIKEDLNTEERK